jgi:hypothetical protein
MINTIYAIRMPLPIRSVSQCARRSLDLMFQHITGIILFLFNLEFKFLLIHESNFHVTAFSYRSNTCDAVGTVSRSWAASDMPTITTSSWILVATPAVGHPAQSFSTPPAPSSQGYWSPPQWAPPVGGQAPLWGMPPWMIPMPKRLSSSPPMVSHLYLLSIVPFIIRSNVK